MVIEKPKLVTLKDHLGNRPDVGAVRELITPTYFGTLMPEVIERVDLLVAPKDAIREPGRLTDFMNGFLSSFSIDHRQVGKWRLAPTNLWRSRFSLPNALVFEDLGEFKREKEVRTTWDTQDMEALERHRAFLGLGESIGQKTQRYRRTISIHALPDESLINLYIKFRNQQQEDRVAHFPPGTQSDLNGLLFYGLNPQLYRRWSSGADLNSFYFDSQGRFIPKFYIISGEESSVNLSKKADISDSGHLKVIQFTGGTPEAAKILLWRKYKNMTVTDVARAMFTGNRSAEFIESVEKGLIRLSKKELFDITAALSVDRSDVEDLMIYQGDRPRQKGMNRKNPLRYIIAHQGTEDIDLDIDGVQISRVRLSVDERIAIRAARRREAHRRVQYLLEHLNSTSFETSTVELMRRTGFTHPQLMAAVKELQEFGLIRSRKEGRMIYYSTEYIH